MFFYNQFLFFQLVEGIIDNIQPQLWMYYNFVVFVELLLCF